eukprot:5651023-Amphidinium_carterae.2
MTMIIDDSISGEFLLRAQPLHPQSCLNILMKEPLKGHDRCKPIPVQTYLSMASRQEKPYASKAERFPAFLSCCLAGGIGEASRFKGYACHLVL